MHAFLETITLKGERCKKMTNAVYGLNPKRAIYHSNSETAMKHREIQDRPLLIAHRGYRSRYPENTMAAFQAAINLGAGMIELDVALTRDRALVVLHDDTVDRTTNGQGPVIHHNLVDLRRLDAGSWFSAEFAGEKVPLLSEVLELTKGRTKVNIEIKDTFYEEWAGRDAIEQQVVELVNKMDLNDEVLISSFEIGYLLRLSLMEDAPALALISDQPADEQTIEQLKTIGAFSWHPWYRILTTEQVALMHTHGIEVYAYTVNSRSDFEALIEMGLDGVFTDDLPGLSPRRDQRTP
jgi:glycerophosphoryl diester phosphodiesterase